MDELFPVLPDDVLDVFGSCCKALMSVALILLVYINPAQIW
jgi:hypothetical protein